MAEGSHTTALNKPEKFGRHKLEPGPYRLDLSSIARCPVHFNNQPSTFIEVLRKLLAVKVMAITGLFFQYKYVTENGELSVAVPREDEDHWLLVILKYLVELAGKGVDIDRAVWFYYDHDWSRDADESYVFFVLYDGKIVDESSNFMSVEPRILNRQEDEEPVWHSGPYFGEAWQKYWYRKFYLETQTGQLMVLRPDEPNLYYFQRPQGRDVGREIELLTLVKMYRLLWIVVSLLIAIAYPAIGMYMAIATIFLLIDLVWRCWVKRKLIPN